MKTIRTIRLAAGMVAVLALAACSSHEKPKEVNIQTDTVVHAITFEDGRTKLTTAEYSALGGFMQTVPVSAVSYAGIAADDTSTRAVERAKRIKAYLVKQGVEPAAIHLQPVSASDEDPILLTLEYAKALPPKHCPDWSRNAYIEHANAMDYSNFGCAYDNNLAVQMVNPADYEGVHGRPESDAPRDSISIQKYRTGAGEQLGTTSASSPSTSTSATTSSGSSTSSTGAIGSQ